MNEHYNDYFEQIINVCGYRKCSDNENNVENRFDKTGGAATNFCRDFNSDIKFGFQDIDPMLITVIAEVLANKLTTKMPSIQLNAVGNWLQTIASVIAMFNAQQQYHQAGPGRFYNPVFRNVTNPFCMNPMQGDGFGEGEKKYSKKKKRKDSGYEKKYFRKNRKSRKRNK